MSTIIQRSFASGEIAPALYARVDFFKYQTGLRTCRNFFIMRHGGAANRPGTKFIGEVSDSSKTVRLIPFIFSEEQTYVMEFGNYYVRFIKDGDYLKEAATTITGITQANPAVVSITAHGYSDGDEVYISSVVGMTEVNGRNFKVANSATNTFSLQYMDGTDVNSSSFTAYSSGGTAEKIYEIESGWISADLMSLQFTQSADVVIIVHPDYPARKLVRNSELDWEISPYVLSPSISAPTSVSATGGPAGSGSYTYVVTSISSDNFEESIQSSGANINPVGVPTVADPILISWTAATGAQEYNVYRQLNGILGLIGVSGSTTFSDIGLDPDTSLTPPLVRNPFDGSANDISNITQANPAVLTYTGTDYYSNGDTVYVASVEGMTEINNRKFVVTNLNAGANTFQLYDEDGNAVDSTSYTAYSSAGIVNLVGYYPSAVTFYQQRLCFANTDLKPENVWTSRTGKFYNFTVKSPSQEDDAITFTLAGRRVNEIKHMIDIGKLVLFTNAGEWTLSGGDNGVLSPSSINLFQQSYYGANNLPPIIIGNSAIYVQARGSIVRDLGFDFAVDGYRGNDLTIFSSHLFDDYTLIDWSYQQIPHSIIWVVRSDGTLLSLTYVKEQSLLAWAKHDFEGGTVENVCVVPESTEDAVYVTVKRTIDGSTKRYVERIATRNIDDIVDATFLDSYLTYDGRNTSSVTMTLSGGTDWIYTETLTLTASSASFASTDIGNSIHLTGSDGSLIRAEITAYTSTTVVSVKPNKTVPASLRSTATSVWTHAVDQVTGLWHLEGEQVSVFADGFVVANPNNDAYDTITVTDGTISLDKPYGVIHVGLPYISDIETLDIDTTQSETLSDKNKISKGLTLFVEETRGIFAGPKPPTSDTTDPLENLVEFKIRNDEDYDSPVELKTGTIDVNLKAEWNSNGRIFVRQVDPVPASILAIAPSGDYPFRGG